MRLWKSLLLTVMLTTAVASSTGSPQTAKKPNILVIFGNEIGVTNVCAYSLANSSSAAPPATSKQRQLEAR